MSETKFTPGPWRTGPINYADVYGANGELVALVIKHRPETCSDAYLIKAAPELYDALKQIDASWSEDFSGPDNPRAVARFSDRTIRTWKAIRAALAKAEGK